MPVLSLWPGPATCFIVWHLSPLLNSCRHQAGFPVRCAGLAGASQCQQLTQSYLRSAGTAWQQPAWCSPCEGSHYWEQELLTPFFLSPKNTLWSPNMEKSKSQNQPIKWKKKTPNQPTSDICSCHSKFFCFALQILNVILCQYWNGTAWEMQGEIKENNLSFLKCVTRL